MKPHTFLWTIGVCTALIAAPVTAAKYAKAGTVTVDRTFTDWGINWSGSGQYLAKIKLIEINGKIVLCGAGVLTGGINSNFNNQALNSTFMTLNGQPIIKGFRFFANARSKKRLPSAKANCRYTTASAPLKKSDVIDIGSNKTKFFD